MTFRSYAATTVLCGLIAASTAKGQAVKPLPSKVAETKTSAKSQSWKLSRTPDGQPDMQGFWTNATFTPLERPVELGNKEFFTEAEAVAWEKERLARENSQAKNDIHYDNTLWQTENWSRVSNRRTSMIFDPPNGRIPALSAEGQKRALIESQNAKRKAASEDAQSRSLAERCIAWGNEGPPMIGSTYNANLQIVQAAGLFSIRHEIIHGYRVVPLDGSPHLPAAIHQLGGDSRGHWEGETLVVDTTNFSDQTNFRGPPANTRQDIFSSHDMHVTERFTRVDAETIIYRFTVEDPSTWVRPWSGELLMKRTEGPIYEYACHEGNYGLANILAGARAAEREAAKATASKKSRE